MNGARADSALQRAWPMPTATYSPPSCQPPVSPKIWRHTGSTRFFHSSWVKRMKASPRGWSP